MIPSGFCTYSFIFGGNLLDGTVYLIISTEWFCPPGAINHFDDYSGGLIQVGSWTIKWVIFQLATYLQHPHSGFVHEFDIAVYIRVYWMQYWWYLIMSGLFLWSDLAVREMTYLDFEFDLRLLWGVCTIDWDTCYIVCVEVGRIVYRTNMIESGIILCIYCVYVIKMTD